MVLLFNYLIPTIWLLRILLNLFTYIHLWYIKEYRLDRMMIHFGTPQGKKLLFLPFRRPPLSPKTVSLIILSSVVIMILFFTLPGTTIWRLLLIDLLTFPLVSLLVFVLRLPTMIFHAHEIQNAVVKINSHKPMLVIGITGSYGKTSTKEFLTTIIQSKYKTLKTEKSQNSPIGIAEIILQKLEPDHEVFVVEMGAYKIGEIAQMSKMVKPQIGIITAINSQHQDLFKSIENTKKAKFELIESLSGKRLMITSQDMEETRQLGSWGQKIGVKVLFFTTHKKSVASNEFIFAQDIKIHIDHLEFTAVYGKEKAEIIAYVLGEHQVSNILAALAGAINAGLTLQEAAQASGHIKPFTKTMEPVTGVNDSLFINDTFNNNPDAAKVAISYLKNAPGKKILVFQPMIELGEYAHTAHRNVGAHAASICDSIYLTNNNFLEFFTEGVHSVNKNMKIHVLSKNETANQIQKVVGKGDVVLFKGKEAENVLRLFKI